MATAAACTGGFAVLLAGADWASKRAASPGVAAEGLQLATDSTANGAEAEATEGVPAVAVPRLILVYGASGNSGLAFVEAALDAGYCVRAFVRNPDKLVRGLANLSTHARLEIVVGNLTDLNAVEAAVCGVNMVVSCACAAPHITPGPMAAAVPAIVRGCREHGVRRLIYQAAAIAGVPGERWGWFTAGHVTRSIVCYQLGSKVVGDHERVMRYLYNEVRDLEWVVSRPPNVEEGEGRRGPLVAHLDPPRPASISCVDLADWTLQQLDSNLYVGKMPRLGYAPVETPI